MQKHNPAMGLDIPRLLREDCPAAGEEQYDFSARDFSGFAIDGPVTFTWQAAPSGGFVRLGFALSCTITAQCVRCLSAFSAPLHATAEYDIVPQDLLGEYTEYPVAPGGGLDLEELCYGEIVLAAPLLPLCREDCPGLCPTCGAAKQDCTCAANTDAPQDPRWAPLRALLDEE